MKRHQQQEKKIFNADAPLSSLPITKASLLKRCVFTAWRTFFEVFIAISELYWLVLCTWCCNTADSITVVAVQSNVILLNTDFSLYNFLKRDHFHFICRKKKYNCYFLSLYTERDGKVAYKQQWADMFIWLIQCEKGENILACLTHGGEVCLWATVVNRVASQSLVFFVLAEMGKMRQ